MSVNTTYEPINRLVSAEEITAGEMVFNLTWQYNPDVSSIVVQVDDVVHAVETTYDATENTITVPVADLTAGQDVRIRRSTPMTQDESFSEGEYITEQAVEVSLDKLVFIAQELRADGQT